MLLLLKIEKDIVVLILNADDMIITHSEFTAITELKQFLCQDCEMKDLGPLSYLLIAKSNTLLLNPMFYLLLRMVLY